MFTHLVFVMLWVNEFIFSNEILREGGGQLPGNAGREGALGGEGGHSLISSLVKILSHLGPLW